MVEVDETKLDIAPVITRSNFIIAKQGSTQESSTGKAERAQPTFAGDHTINLQNPETRSPSMDKSSRDQIDIM